MTKQLYFFIGLPCSGKTSSAKLIVDKVFGNKCDHISTGDIARTLSTTQELKDKTTANDLFPLEDELRQVLVTKIESSIHSNIIVDGFPRFGGQAEFLISKFWDHNPQIVEISVGDTITLIERARFRGRDTDLHNFANRLDKASKNMSDVISVLDSKFIPRYTLYSGDDFMMINRFKKHFKIKDKPNG